jgi:H+-transporting ATPase
MLVAGHMTLYLARMGEQHFWVRPLPAYQLFLTTELIQIAGTILAVYRILMQPIGWAFAGLVWSYSFVFFLFNDYVKVETFRMLNHTDSNSDTRQASVWHANNSF